MTKLEVLIIDELGLHARPTSRLVELTQSFESEMEIKLGSNKVSMKSLMMVMSLGVKGNDTVTITADGSDEETAIEQIKELMIKIELIK
ncbi:MAG: phosphocarrier protein HPr [Tenericutes bacterium]|nr:MAG: phosphocarrier protein HPr [Mycoplasmatota bacterium]